MVRKAVYAGSFDPPTNGHLWVIEKGAELFDDLTIAIGKNPKKKRVFSLGERLDMLEKITRDFSNVEVDSFDYEYLVNYAKSIEAEYIVRGIRNEGDYRYEHTMRNINSDLEPGIETIFLIPPRDLVEVSSSTVKDLVGPKGWEENIRRYVPGPVYQKLLEKFDGYFTRFEALWKRIGAKQDAKEVYYQLSEEYSEPCRRHHTLVHVAHAITNLDEAVKGGVEPGDPEAIEMAIWGHDRVCNTLFANNEERSAASTYDTLITSEVEESFAKKVRDLIFATKHDEIPKDLDAKILVDIDLVTLGKSPEEFDRYSQNIREEYDWASDEAFKTGRKEFLQKMLDRPFIYSTEFFREKYEAQARRNTERHLAELSK